MIIHICVGRSEITDIISLLTSAYSRHPLASLLKEPYNWMKGKRLMQSSMKSKTCWILCYKVGHYMHINNLTYEQHKNILRSFMFIKQKFLSDSDTDKLKARLVADGSQQGRHLYEFILSATISLQVDFI